VHKNGKSGVWVDQNSKAHFVLVKILARSADMAAVSGISASTTLIVPAADKKPLFEGSGIH
jgi:hypothetical protein